MFRELKWQKKKNDTVLNPKSESEVHNGSNFFCVIKTLGIVQIYLIELLNLIMEMRWKCENSSHI